MDRLSHQTKKERTVPMSYFTSSIIKCQEYICEKIEKTDESKTTYECRSSQKVAKVQCPCCSGKVKGHGTAVLKAYDVPSYPGKPTVYRILRHRYQCMECGVTFIEKDPFSCPGFHLTRNAVEWICQLLAYQISTKTVADLMGIHWNTVRKIQKARIDYILKTRDVARLKSTYRPYFLAVDEFAIHKGHRYATCVMDLVKGEVLWVGKGRDIKGFTKFFEHFKGTDYLSRVKAVAMDMNASYNRLVEEYLPNAEIVYDRYHVQAQYGRDVLGQVRLAEAKRHKERAKEISHGQNPDKKDISEEKKLYSQVKKARWIILSNAENLSENKKASLNEILESHSDLAVCYAMKEELIELFKLTDLTLAKQRWEAWFDAAEQSNIPPLVKFSKLKRRRLCGLVSHAKFPINTGKLEGFNNKIKVAKRNAFGFRNSDYFFSYIRFLSIPFFASGT